MRFECSFSDSCRLQSLQGWASMMGLPSLVRKLLGAAGPLPWVFASSPRQDMDMDKDNLGSVSGKNWLILLLFQP